MGSGGFEMFIFCQILFIIVFQWFVLSDCQFESQSQIIRLMHRKIGQSNDSQRDNVQNGSMQLSPTNITLELVKPKQLNQSIILTQQSQDKHQDRKCCFLIIFGAIVLIGVVVFVVVYFTVIIKIKRTQVYDLVKLNSTSALCLDGSTAVYHVSRTGDPSKILIYFMGGGWCAGQTDQRTLERCYQRSYSKLGSSNYNLDQQKQSEGILSNHQDNYFRDWKRVFFDYCDGSGHQGSKKQPVQYKDRLLYFRGSNITIQRFQDLQNKLGLFTRAQKVVISGQSAGGLATLLWTNYLAERVQKGKVWSIPDAPLFFDAENKNTKTHLQKEKFKNLLKITNAQVDIPVPQCLNQFPNAKQNCMFFQNIFRHIKVPLFVSQSQYDTYSIWFILGIGCVHGGEIDCNQQDRWIIQKNRLGVIEILQQIAKNKSNGVWGIGCVKHQTLTIEQFTDDYFTIPQNSQYTVNTAIGLWMQNPNQNNIHLDLNPWPSNRPCS